MTVDRSHPGRRSIPRKLAYAFMSLVVSAAVLVARGPSQVSPSLPQQPAATESTFEVASIKRNVSGQASQGRRANDRFTAVAVPVLQLLGIAYDVNQNRIVNVPDWTRVERYDIDAKAPDGQQVGPALPSMMRSLLRDRLALQSHNETREMPIYELVQDRDDGRLGPNLQPASCDCRGNRQEAGCRRGAPLPSMPEVSGITCAQLGMAGRKVFRGYPMDTFARYLSSGMDRAVIDRTGLTGTWNAYVDTTTFTGTNGQPPDELASLFTAVREQLGLRLRPARGSVEVVVIDRIERPTEN